MDIDFPYTEKVSELSSKSGYPTSDIVRVYEMELKNLQDANPGKDVKELAWTRTFNTVKREAKSMADVPFRYIMVLGNTGDVDSLERIRNIAKRTYETNPTEAIGKYVTTDGQVIDTREFLKGKIPNPNYNGILPDNEHVLRHDIFGLVSDTVTFDQVSPAAIRGFEDNVKRQSGVKLYGVYTFKAWEKVYKNSTIRTFNVSSATRYVPITISKDMVEILNQVDTVSVSDLAKIMIKADEEKKYVPTLAILGNIDVIYTNEHMKTVVISSDSYDVDNLNAYIRGECPYLEAGWEVIVFGRPRKGTKKTIVYADGIAVRDKRIA